MLLSCFRTGMSDLRATQQASVRLRTWHWSATFIRASPTPKDRSSGKVAPYRNEMKISMVSLAKSLISISTGFLS